MRALGTSFPVSLGVSVPPCVFEVNPDIVEPAACLPHKRAASSAEAALGSDTEVGTHAAARATRKTRWAGSSARIDVIGSTTEAE
jgi:hypothetical protein